MEGSGKQGFTHIGDGETDRRIRDRSCSPFETYVTAQACNHQKVAGRFGGKTSTFRHWSLCVMPATRFQTTSQPLFNSAYLFINSKDRDWSID